MSFWAGMLEIPQLYETREFHRALSLVYNFGTISRTFNAPSTPPCRRTRISTPGATASPIVGRVV